MKKVISFLSYLFITSMMFFGVLIIQSFTNAAQDDTPTLLRHIKALEETLLMANLEKEIDNNNLNRKVEAYLIGSKKQDDVGVLVKVQQVRAQTSAIRLQIAAVRMKLINETGGYTNNDPRQQYVGAKDIEKTELLIIGTPGAKSGAAYSLQTALNKFVEDINTTLPVAERKFLPLAADPQNDFSIIDPAQKTKDYPTYHFKGIPMVMVLAELAKIESTVLVYEKRFLKIYADKAGEQSVGVDAITPVVIPYSRTVTGGTYYEAEISVFGVSGLPVINYNGSNVPVNPVTRRGKIRFLATSPRNEEIEKKEYRYSVSFKVKGKDTTIIGTEIYYVKKPVVKITSVNRKVLYKQCGNELLVNIPDFGEFYNPSFSAQGAEVLKGAQKGAIVISPNQDIVELKISNDENYIGIEIFKVVNPPQPSIEVRLGTKFLDRKQGPNISSSDFKTFSIKATADTVFRSFYPKDARYKIQEWQCTVVRGYRHVHTKVFTEESVDLSSVIEYASPGDRLLIEVTKLTRVNFINKVITVNPNNHIINVPLN